MKIESVTFDFHGAGMGFHVSRRPLPESTRAAHNPPWSQFRPPLLVMHALLEQHRADIVRICERHRIRRLEVFGSAARGIDFDPETSDADFLVEFDVAAKRGLESYYALKADLEALLERDVDLVEPATLRNPYRLRGVNSARELVYAA